jgi:MFS family permease
VSARTRTGLLALGVGLVLADSAVVTLALPDVLRGYDASVAQVAWVLTAFNIVLALAAVPAARLVAHGRVRAVGIGGLAVFATASAVCALAPSLEALVAARVVQAVGGAAALGAALELLVAVTGSEESGAGIWVRAGVAGAAVGPVAGGLLTQAISWQSIFVAQVPLAGVALAAFWVPWRAGASSVLGPGDAASAQERKSVPGPDTETTPAASQRPHAGANLALLLVSGGLTAALFLLVLLLVEGWRHDPAVAALTVSAIPIAAAGSASVARRARASERAEASAGAILVAGGLVCLGFLPHASIWWTLPAQALIGLGMGLTLAALTSVALRNRGPLALHGGWTIAARHAGVVLGLLLLTPVFSADLDTERGRAEEAGTALLLDARIAPVTKVALADEIATRLAELDGRLPDLEPAFAAVRPRAGERTAYAALEDDLRDQVDRAATHAFSASFLVAAGLALLGLVPALLLSGLPRRRPREAVA